MLEACLTKFCFIIFKIEKGDLKTTFKKLRNHK